MDPSIIICNAVQGEAFLPGQIFVFGSFTLRTDPLGHLEQIVSGSPDSYDEHGLDLPSHDARDITPAEASDLNPGQDALPKDRGLDPTPQAYPHRQWGRTQAPL